jgi:hypothetical protein
MGGSDDGAMPMGQSQPDKCRWPAPPVAAPTSSVGKIVCAARLRRRAFRHSEPRRREILSRTISTSALAIDTLATEPKPLRLRFREAPAPCGGPSCAPCSRCRSRARSLSSTAAPRPPLGNPAEEPCLVTGSRSGKSFALGLIAVFLACFRGYTSVLAPGGGHRDGHRLRPPPGPHGVPLHLGA